MAVMIGILVLYSETYADKALREFALLMRAVDPSCRLIAVSNNPAIADRSPDYVWRQWRNDGAEFGAWQHALDTEARAEDTAVVFANDTFCWHRHFGRLERMAFVRAFRRHAGASTAVICGDISRSRRPFRLLDQDMRCWISTYLFMINAKALASVNGQIRSDPGRIRGLLNGGESAATFFADSMDARLREHLQSWLFRQGGSRHWYRAAPLTPANREQMERKAVSILHEKLLSARALAAGVVLQGVCDGRSYRLLHRVRGWLAA